MAAYPSIPFFEEVEGWQQSEPKNAKIRTQMDSGPAKQRRRFTAAPKTMQGRIPYIDETDLATFEAFYETTLKMGALSFTATHPVTLATESFRFPGGYTITPRGVGFSISAELEILP